MCYPNIMRFRCRKGNIFLPFLRGNHPCALICLVLNTILMYTDTQSTFQCFKSGGQSAGWGCRVSLAQLCQRGQDMEGGTERKLKYGSTVTRTHTFTRGLDNVCKEQRVVHFPSTSSWTRSQANFISLCSMFGTKPYKK